METSRQFKYDVFISYSRADYVDSSNNVIPGNIISQIKDLFQKENIRYWFDEDGISHGDAFVEVITEAIIDSESFLFISSENSNSSKWTNKEIALANHFEKKIIPFKIDGSFYNKSVAFYLVDIDHIEYYVNPDKAMEGLFGSLIEPIRKREQELILQKEEARKKAEELRLEKEQQQRELVSEIKIDTDQLGLDEKAALIAREKLMLKVKKVENEEQRNNLQKEIENTGAITKSYLLRIEEQATEFLDKIQEKDKEIQALHKELESLKISANNDDVDKLKKALNARTEHCNSLIMERDKMKQQVDRQNMEIQNLKNKLKIQQPVQKKGTSEAHVSEPFSAIFILTFIAMSIVSAMALCFAYDMANEVTYLNRETPNMTWAFIEALTCIISLIILFFNITRHTTYYLAIIPSTILGIMAWFETTLIWETSLKWPTLFNDGKSFIPLAAIMLAIYLLGTVISWRIGRKRNL